MQVGMSGARLVARDDATGRWLPIGGPWHDDLLAFLAGGARARAEARPLMAVARPVAAPDGLPFRPRSLRQFALWEEHMANAARMLVRRFAPPHTRALVAAYERATRRIFPALRPGAKFREVPGFYPGNYTTVIPDGATVPWPRHTATSTSSSSSRRSWRTPCATARPPRAAPRSGASACSTTGARATCDGTTLAGAPSAAWSRPRRSPPRWARPWSPPTRSSAAGRASPAGCA